MYILLSQIPGVDQAVESASRVGWEAVMLVVVICAIGFAAWKLMWATWHKLFGNDDKGTPGLVGDWVAEEKRWRTGLTERLESQASQCGLHNETVKGLTNILAEQKTVSLASEKSLAESNVHLAKLVELHDPRGSIGMAAQQISSNSSSLNDLKAAGCHLCDLLEDIAAKEIPNSAPAVVLHCTRIRELIGK